jgi:hypothetical protein
MLKFEKYPKLLAAGEFSRYIACLISQIDLV